jgi:hypothetical protein
LHFAFGPIFIDDQIEKDIIPKIEEKAEENDLTGERREVRKILADATINSFILRSSPYKLPQK